MRLHMIGIRMRSGRRQRRPTLWQDKHAFSPNLEPRARAVTGPGQASPLAGLTDALPRPKPECSSAKCSTSIRGLTFM